MPHFKHFWVVSLLNKNHIIKFVLMEPHTHSHTLTQTHTHTHTHTHTLTQTHTHKHIHSHTHTHTHTLTQTHTHIYVKTHSSQQPNRILRLNACNEIRVLVRCSHILLFVWGLGYSFRQGCKNFLKGFARVSREREFFVAKSRQILF